MEKHKTFQNRSANAFASYYASLSLGYRKKLFSIEFMENVCVFCI